MEGAAAPDRLPGVIAATEALRAGAAPSCFTIIVPPHPGAPTLDAESIHFPPRRELTCTSASEVTHTLLEHDALVDRQLIGGPLFPLENAR
jgi:hypothetical protein